MEGYLFLGCEGLAHNSFALQFEEFEVSLVEGAFGGQGICVGGCFDGGSCRPGASCGGVC
ncbi:hypothetical protein BO226_24545 (plasmid) [Rhodococcus sp. 2G]|nr:hypothetical protein BO226_24545 [Rhodococcus sp. 2G]